MMWSVLYTGFWAALASGAASALSGRFLKGKKKRPIMAIAVAAVSGTVLLGLGLCLPVHIASLRRALRPESEIEGAWIQTSHDSQDARIKHGIVRIRFDSVSSAFELTGRTYIITEQDNQVLVTKRAEWKSMSMTVRAHTGNFEGVYSYAAVITEKQFQNVDGFGKITFDCKKDGTTNFASGYYLDTRTKNPVDIELQRVRDDHDALFSSNPEELLRHHFKQPKDVVWID